GAREGNASHYYSLTRMPTRGAITIDGERFEVTGHSWMDHEFSTSFLEPEQRGWDWFSIQLSDNRELMLYRMRRADGSHDPRSSGTLIAPGGQTTHLTNDHFTLTPGRSTFKSPNGAAYPTEWTVSVPAHRIELKVTTPLANQELSLVESTGIAYWEGMIDVTGRSGNQAVSGAGYLEMTGYHGSLGRIFTGS
ncbi:MAG TPA: lipocalin family protein, partial [Vicinamibacterales bacterium]|nr:lipocalin family protein [Vicinamibacterales bacterium]